MLVRRAYIPDTVRPAGRQAWPYSIPCVAELAAHGMEFTAPLTFLVGENGSGKSTIVEALAEAFKLDSHGGKAGRRYVNDRAKTPLGEVLRLDTSPAGTRMLNGPRAQRKGFFLRAETAFEVMNSLSGRAGYWDADTAQMSHGEGFLTVFTEQFTGPGFYLLDEPESALSFSSSLQLVALMTELARIGAQIVCATHSPILAAAPGAAIIEVGDHGMRSTTWDELSLVAHWRRYLNDPAAFLRHMAS